MIDMKNFRFTEQYVNEYYDTTTLYFDGPVSLLPSPVADAVGADISVEFPTSTPDARCANVCIASVIENEYGKSSVDWSDWDIPYEDVEALMALAGY